MGDVRKLVKMSYSSYAPQTSRDPPGISPIAHERAETPSPAAAHMPVSCVSLCAVLLAGPSSVVAMLAHARGPLRPSPWAARSSRAKMSAGVAVPETFFWDGKRHVSSDGKGACLIIPDGTKHIWPLEALSFGGQHMLIQSIIIPDTVTELKVAQFRGCKSLRQITIPNSVVRIEDGAFQGCESLASITVPDSVTHMGDQVFFECTRWPMSACPTP